MKKILLILVVVTTTVMSADAQVRFGAKAGANFYNFGGDDVEGEEFKTKTGFHFGAMVNIPVSEQFSVQPEVVYSIEGAKLSEGDDRIIL